MNNASKHPTDHQLDAYRNGELLSSDLVSHIEHCPFCQQQLAAFQAVDKFILTVPPPFPAGEVIFWSAAVIKQVEILEKNREKAADRRLWILSLSALSLAIIGLGFAGTFGSLGTVWSLISDSFAGISLIAGTSICILLYLIDRIEKKLALDPVQLTLLIHAGKLTSK